MKKLLENLSFKNFLKNEWVITLSATLIGVFLALYLNDWSKNRTLEKTSSIATNKILNELNNNEYEINQALESHNRLREIYIFLGENLGQNGNLISEPLVMNNFRKKHPEILIITDSIRFDNIRFKYKGEINLNLNLTQLNLKTIAWRTFQDTKVSSLYDFNCLMNLEAIYTLINEIKENNKLLLEYLTGKREQGQNYINILKHLNLVIDFEVIFITTIEETKDKLKNCG